MFPLIEIERKIPYNKGYYFEDWEKIKKQVCYNWEDWLKRIKTLGNAYSQISKLKEFYWHIKTDDFYKQYEKIYRECLIIGINEFRNYIYQKKGKTEINSLSFEGLSYHIICNTNNILKLLHSSIPKSLKDDEIKKDFQDYEKSTKTEDKDIYLYNYILRLQDIFEGRIKEFKKQDKKIKITPPDISDEQKKLLMNYYSINSDLVEDKPKIIMNYERQFQSMKNKDNNLEKISSEKYLIIGNQCNPVDKKILEDKLNLK